MFCTWSVHENTCIYMHVLLLLHIMSCSESDSNSAAVSANNNIQVNEKGHVTVHMERWYKSVELIQALMVATVNLREFLFLHS